MITPADNPNMAIISGYGVRLCLRVGGSGKDVSLRLCSATRSHQLLQAPNGTQVEIISATSQVILPPLQEALVISEFSSDASWTVGRAGMRYRDLVPSRLGGRVIASHIHIPNGDKCVYSTDHIIFCIKKNSVRRVCSTIHIYNST